MTELSKLPVPPNCPYFETSEDGAAIFWYTPGPWPKEARGVAGVPINDLGWRPIICAVAADYWDREKESLWKRATEICTEDVGHRTKQPKEQDYPEFHRLCEEHSKATGAAHLWRNAGRETE